jgi:hypothetical protein
MLLMLYLQMASFLISLGFVVAFFVTGRKNRLLSSVAGVFLLIGCVLQLLNRGA